MTSAKEWASRGTRLLAAGAFGEAQQCFESAIRLEPRHSTHWALLGKCQAMLAGYHAAEEALARACSLDPRAAFPYVWLGHALREQNRPDAAVAAFERAAALEPDNVNAAIGAALVMPVVYRDLAEIDRWRERYRAGLERLLADTACAPGWARSILKLEWSNFYLAYQGGNDRQLQAAYSDFIAGLLARIVPEWQADIRSARPPDRRIHVGFVSSHLRNHTVADYFGAWITDLPRDRFHVAAYYTGHGSGARTEEFRAAADHFEQLPDDVHRIASVLRAQNLDVIVYPDVGMSPLDQLLCNLRLARTQLAAWGHPVTTGSRHIDAYLSCAEMEPENAHDHYREELLLLPGIGVNYRAPRAPGAADRAQFRLSPGSHVYACPQSLFKIHPATDPLFLDIMEQDARAVLVFVAAPSKGQTDAFIGRITGGMARRGIAMRNQIKFLPNLPHDAFLGLLGVADVMIDALHWSGGRTALDALSAGLPIVTLPGAQMRSRQSAAMLRIIGLEELIAGSAEDYVSKGLRIAGDRAYRSMLSARIREGLPKLFGRHEPIAALAAAIERIHRQRAP